MPKIKQLSILIILFSLIFLLTGCDTHKLNGDNVPQIKSLPDKLTTLLQNKTNVKFAHIHVEFNDGEKVLFKRLEKDDKGANLYNTTVIQNNSLPFSKIKKISTYSRTRIDGVVKVGGQDYQNCNYISIDNKEELICQRIEKSEYLFSETENDIPDEVVEEIRKETGKDVTSLVLTGSFPGSVNSVILKHKNYEFVDKTKTFDPKINVTTRPETIVSILEGRGSPCCCIIDDGDIKYRTCKKKC